MLIVDPGDLSTEKCTSRLSSVAPRHSELLCCEFGSGLVHADN